MFNARSSIIKYQAQERRFFQGTKGVNNGRCKKNKRKGNGECYRQGMAGILKQEIKAEKRGRKIKTVQEVYRRVQPAVVCLIFSYRSQRNALADKFAGYRQEI